MVADVRQVHEHPHSVHLTDDHLPERREAGVVRLVAGATDHVLVVVGELGNADSESVKDLNEAIVVTEGTGVLKTQKNADPILLLGIANLLGRRHESDEVGMRGLQLAPIADESQCLGRALPDRARRVHSVDAAVAQFLEHLRAPVVDLQTVDDNRVPMHLGDIHFSSSCFGGPTNNQSSSAAPAATSLTRGAPTKSVTRSQSVD